MASDESQPFHWHFLEFEEKNSHVFGRLLLLGVIISSVLISIAFLIFYAHRWVCRYRQPSTNTTSAISSSTAAPAQARLHGLDAATVDSLPISLHHSSPSITTCEDECCICLGIIEDKEKVKVLPQCHHCYHSECIDEWFTGHFSCPLCRVSLRVDDLSI